MVNLVLFQPDIPQNLGAVIRICSCFAVHLHIIEPCGFPLDDKRIRRVGMDYIDSITWQRHSSWESFVKYQGEAGGRLILSTTKARKSIYSLKFAPDDWVIFGRESSGAPQEVHNLVDERVIIPMKGDARSLNIAISAAIILSEAGRQLN